MIESKEKMWKILKTPHSQNRLLLVSNFTLPNNMEAEVRFFSHMGEELIRVYVDGAQLHASQVDIKRKTIGLRGSVEVHLLNYDFTMVISR